MKRKVISLITVVSMMFALMSLLTTTALADAADLEISTLAEFEAFRDDVNNGNTYEGKNIVLTADIDLGGSENNQWTPIGRWIRSAEKDETGSTHISHVDVKYFQGTFDGNNHTISGLYINQECEDYQAPINNDADYRGLFGVSSGTIKNLNVRGTVTGKEYVGGIVAFNSGTLNNCRSFVSVIGDDEGTGGVVGENNHGTIENCHNFGDVTGRHKYWHGGVVGYSSCGTITNCSNSGTITGNYVGGIVGVSNDSNITNCHNIGTVTGSQVGGIVGRTSKTNVMNCYNTGSISGNQVGGIVSTNMGNTIENCYNTGSVSGSGEYDRAGGIAASNYGTITNCYNTGNVTSTYTSGGVVGDNHKVLTNCYNVGSVSCSGDYIGGAVGTNNQNSSGVAGTTENCYYIDTCGAAGDGSSIDRNAFSQITTFTNWDFNDIWEMNALIGRPVFKSMPEAGITGSGTKESPYLISDASALMTLRNCINAGGGKDTFFELENDIDMSDINIEDNTWEPIGTETNKFSGIFDGKGHAISGLNQNIFGYSNGTIKNLNISNSEADSKSAISLCSDNTSYDDDYIGGVVKYNEGTVENCCNKNAVSGNRYVGGIAGYNKGTIANCYNIDSVTGGEYVGSIVGHNDGTVTNCYYDNTVYIVEDTTNGVTGKPTDSFNNGEITYLLQSAQTNKDDNENIIQVWGQTVGEGYPKLTNNNDKTVYKVTFATENNPEYAVSYANSINNIDLPIAPVSDKYLFKKWSLTKAIDGEEFTKQTPISDDITVYAIYEEMSENYSITLNEDGSATVTSPTSGTYCVIFVAYKDGMLKCVKSENVVFDKPGTELIERPDNFDDSDSDTIKVLFWNNINDMKPLCPVA